jgi:hypothetical protein
VSKSRNGVVRLRNLFEADRIPVNQRHNPPEGIRCPQLPLANAIRALSMDAVEKAQSGHCGCRWASRMLRRCCIRNS